MICDEVMDPVIKYSMDGQAKCWFPSRVKGIVFCRINEFEAGVAINLFNRFNLNRINSFTSPISLVILHHRRNLMDRQKVSGICSAFYLTKNNSILPCLNGILLMTGRIRLRLDGILLWTNHILPCLDGILLMTGRIRLRLDGTLLWTNRIRLCLDGILLENTLFHSESIIY